MLFRKDAELCERLELEGLSFLSLFFVAVHMVPTKDWCAHKIPEGLNKNLLVARRPCGELTTTDVHRSSVPKLYSKRENIFGIFLG
jgi:hypothetical protein